VIRRLTDDKTYESRELFERTEMRRVTGPHVLDAAAETAR
jgi:hypothetical protein